tara:strand:- start:50702 stop:50959 length:258 start_codon:yes stop_codon:yes gene_type:complete
LAKHGYYPLFDNLIDGLGGLPNHKKLTGNEKAKAKTLFKRLCEHRTLERQRTVLSAMNIDDQELFLRAFFKMVENEILDSDPVIH